MPELPEVETVTNDLRSSVVGAKILHFSSSSPKQIVPALEIVRKALEGAKIIQVKRRAKLILLVWQRAKEPEKYLGIHLKMTGRLLLREKGEEEDLHTRAIFILDKNRELRFCDVRKFGYLRLFLNEKELQERVHNRLGPEPFSKEFSLDYLVNKIKNRNINIKALVMDQTIISGIGNIYANEALFLAKIKPHRSARTLEKKEIELLHKAIKEALQKGIKYRGSSARDENYRDLFGKLGSYQKHFLVYEQKNKACPRGCGAVLQYERLSGRGTFWCPRCQR